MVRKTALIALLVFFTTGITGCRDSDAPRKVNLEKRETLPQQVEPHVSGKPLRIAVGGMITPREGFAYYREFLDYIGAKAGRKIEFIDREKYEEVNQLIRSGDIDVAFVCAGPYVDGHAAFGMELLAAPQAYGKSVYYSYIIAAKDSPIVRFEDLRGKVFAFADPDSNSGRLVPEYMLAVMNETPDGFFKRYIFTYAHDKSIKAVAEGIVDGAAVDSLIWDYADKTNPQYTKMTKIIRKSPPYGIPPVVVRPGLDPGMKSMLKKIFLHAHEDPAGREIMKKMMIDKFVVIQDDAYNSVREMKSWVAQQRKKGTQAK